MVWASLYSIIDILSFINNDCNNFECNHEPQVRKYSFKSRPACRQTGVFWLILCKKPKGGFKKKFEEYFILKGECIMRNTQKYFVFLMSLGFVVIVLVIFSDRAYAYIDPATMGTIYQVGYVFFYGFLAFLFFLFRPIKNLFLGIFRKIPTNETSTGETPSQKKNTDSTDSLPEKTAKSPDT